MEHHVFYFASILISAAVFQATASEKAKPLNISGSFRNRCKYAPNLTVGNRQDELHCCNVTYGNFSQRWASGYYYLSTLLESLQGWKCPRFNQECNKRTFAYNKFTSLMYDRFCNHSNFELTCRTELQMAVGVQFNTSKLAWQGAVQKLNSLNLNAEQIAKPCIQVAMYERDNHGYGHYHEVVQPFIPFCPFIWCGFDESVVVSKKVSVWTCMPQKCRTNIIVIIVFCVILAIAIFVCNATVLLVFVSNHKIRHGQAMYRFSLAMADILVGIVVFPTFISTLVKYLVVEHSIGRLQNVTGFVLDKEGNVTGETSSIELRGESGFLSERFSQSYLNAVGFFTVLSLSVSVYTLVVAGFDRWFAISRPLKYNQKRAFQVACGVSVLLWIIGLLFSTLPFYPSIKSLRYGVVNSILISSSGPKVPILYGVAFIIPLVLMWIVTIATYCVSKKLTSQWSDLSNDWHTAQSVVERRLTITLGIMVGVFTLSILPVVIVLLVVLGLPDVYYTDPTNLNQQSAVAISSSELVLLFILMCNSLWNCFIYSIREKDFRSAAGKMYSNLAHLLRLDALWNRIRGNVGLMSTQQMRDPISSFSDSHLGQSGEETHVVSSHNTGYITNGNTNNTNI